MKTSPTQRSLKHLRDNGYTSAVVEKWNMHAKIRQDLFGGIDIVALKGECKVVSVFSRKDNMTVHQVHSPGVLGVQSTSDANVAARRTKLLALPELRLWVECGNRLAIHGWSKKGARGKRKLWTLREVELTLADFDNESAPATS